MNKREKKMHRLILGKRHKFNQTINQESEYVVKCRRTGLLLGFGIGAVLIIFALIIFWSL